MTIYVLTDLNVFRMPFHKALFAVVAINTESILYFLVQQYKNLHSLSLREKDFREINTRKKKTTLGIQ